MSSRGNSEKRQRELLGLLGRPGSGPADLSLSDEELKREQREIARQDRQIAAEAKRRKAGKAAKTKSSRR